MDTENPLLKGAFMVKYASFLFSLGLILVTITYAKTKYVAPENSLKSMMEISRALGVKCDYCHIEDKTVSVEDVDKYDPAKDLETLVHKRVARAMMGMQKKFNEEHGGNLKCIDCHDGHPLPPEKKP